MGESDSNIGSEQHSCLQDIQIHTGMYGRVYVFIFKYNIYLYLFIYLYVYSCMGWYDCKLPASCLLWSASFLPANDAEVHWLLPKKDAQKCFQEVKFDDIYHLIN